MNKMMKKTAKTKASKKEKEARPLPKLTQARKSRGFSLDALGEELGISGAQLFRIEKGENELSVTRLAEICRILNTVADELIDLPVKGKAAQKSCDKALLGTVIDTIVQTASSLHIAPSSEELSSWSSYVYDEVLAENLDFRQTKELAAHIVKISTKLKA